MKEHLIYRDTEECLKKPVKVGMVVKIRGEFYIIARSESNTVVLLNLRSGTRWSDSSSIPAMTQLLSSDEFQKILGSVSPEEITIIGFARDIVEIKE